MLIETNGKVEVNKELAQKIFNECDNSLNREFIPAKVRKYQKDMINGKWNYNGDTIRITTDGHLVDGQHRLQAVIESDTVQDFYFIVDLERIAKDGVEIFEVIDQESRKPHEVLKIANPTINNPKEMFALMLQLNSFNNMQFHKSPNGKKVAINELVDFTEDFIPLSTLDSFIERGLRLASRNIALSKKEWILLASTIDQLDKGNKFLEALAGATYEEQYVYDTEGFILEFTHPIANLLYNLDRKYQNKLDQKMRYTVIFNAYQAFRTDTVQKPKSVGSSKFQYPQDYSNYEREDA